MRRTSPHLLIYRAQYTSLASIFQRISGTFLAFIFLFSSLVTYYYMLGFSVVYFYGLIWFVQESSLVLVTGFQSLLSFLFSFHIVNGLRFLVIGTPFSRADEELSLVGYRRSTVFVLVISTLVFVFFCFVVVY